MKYAIITYGSRGDIQPFIALSLGLSARGHEVTLMANENFKQFVESHGISYYPLYGNIEALVNSSKMLRLLQSGNLVTYLKELRQLLGASQPRVNDDMLSGCIVSDADVLVASPLTLAWVYSIAESLNKKWAVVHLSFPMIPTGEFPFAGLAVLNWKPYNLLSFYLARNFFWQLNKKDIDLHRKTLQLPKLRVSALENTLRQKVLNLHAISASLIPKPKDWPGSADISGFLHLPSSPENHVSHPEDLKQWLMQGEKPVYVGFGSIPIPNPYKFAEIIKELLLVTKHRFVFCTGWSMTPGLPAHVRLFSVDVVNHEWLFPQCKAAVIHGGAGTLAAVLRAKTPLIIVSIFADQPLWGRLVQDKKLGIHIPFRKVTTQKLRDAIARVSQPDILKTVQLTGDELLHDDGLSLAVQKLEDYFRKRLG